MKILYHIRRAAALLAALAAAAAFAGCTPAADALEPTAAPAAASPAYTPAQAAEPAPSAAASGEAPGEAGVLAALGIEKEALLGFTNVDLDGDGVLDTAALFTTDAPEGEYVTKLSIASVGGGGKALVTPLDFPDGLARNSIQLLVIPCQRQGLPLSFFALAGGAYGGTVEHVGYSVLKWGPSGWTDTFAKYRDAGMSYTLTMEDGPKATLTLSNGNIYPLEPSDTETYLESGWIGQDGKLTKDAHVFGEHTGFSSLIPTVTDGVLALSGTQEIRGLHKLDVLATLNTVWKYDGADWSATADVEPVVG